MAIAGEVPAAVAGQDVVAWVGGVAGADAGEVVVVRDVVGWVQVAVGAWVHVEDVVVQLDMLAGRVWGGTSARWAPPKYLLHVGLGAWVGVAEAWEGEVWEGVGVQWWACGWVRVWVCCVEQAVGAAGCWGCCCWGAGAAWVLFVVQCGVPFVVQCGVLFVVQCGVLVVECHVPEPGVAAYPKKDHQR